MAYYYPGAFMVLPPDTVFFVTTTVIDWVDVFTRDEYKKIIVESLDFCRRKKGLRIYAWVLMTNHLHLILSHDVDNKHLASVIGDFKKFTSKAVIQAIIDNPKESRRRWLLAHFEETHIVSNPDAVCARSKFNHGHYIPVEERNHPSLENVKDDSMDYAKSPPAQHDKSYHLWQRGYDSYCIYNIKHLRQKIDYLHANPVRAGIVDHPRDYRHSSYRNYCDEPGELEIDLLNLGISDPTKFQAW